MKTKIKNFFDEVGEVVCDGLPYVMVVLSFLLIIYETIKFSSAIIIN